MASTESKYPDWLKYYTFRSILKMGRCDKKKKAFTERYGGAIAPFPDLNREALAIVLGDIEKHEGGNSDLEFTKRFDIKEEIKQQYCQLLKQKNFAKLYALGIEEFKPIPEELLKITEGEWKKFSRGSDHNPLVESISDYGTGWCLRGEAMAERYLIRDQNDLYIYYSLDKEGKPNVPRVVMVVNSNGRIAEVRGVAEEENLDPYIGNIVETKLSQPEFEEEGKAYKKKSADMKLLTEIEKKTKTGQRLDKNDLIFLYEIDSQIEGFGYQRDPRIEEIRKARNKKEDMLVIFECSNDQIAEGPEEINENTKAYVGEWNMEIFQKIRKYPRILHLYESFPDKKIFMRTLETDPAINSPESAEETFEEKNIYRSSWGKDILHKTQFSKESRKYDLVRFTVEQLGFSNGATTDEIYQRAEKLGLELCPAEVGPQLRLQYPGKEWMLIAMKQITDRDGDPDVFYLGWDGGRLALRAGSARPGYWRSRRRVCFPPPQGNLDTLQLENLKIFDALAL
ncbi:MAG: hypothetical protein NT170_01450 [Candidatus Moranbacteria bacterium]|nr:hypothetical protein [Candidatus Moranbacteria bacterium]